MKNNKKKTVLASVFSVACVAAISGGVWINSQALDTASLKPYGTDAEITRYENSLSASDKLKDLFTSKEDKENEARHAIRSYRNEERDTAEKAVAVIFDASTGTVKKEANSKTVNTALKAVSVLPKDDKTGQVLSGNINTVKAYLAAEKDASDAVDGIYKDDALVDDTTRDQYNTAKAKVDALNDVRPLKGELNARLAKADTALTVIEKENAANAAVDAVYKDDQLVGNRSAYKTAVNAVNALADGDLKTSLNDRLSKANTILTQQEEEARQKAEAERQRKAAEAAQRQAEAAAKKAAQASAQPSGNTSNASGNTQASAPAQAPAAPSVKYTWTSAQASYTPSFNGQALVNKGYLTETLYTESSDYTNGTRYYAGEIRCTIGKQIKSLHVGDIVNVDGRLVQIVSEYNDNYNRGGVTQSFCDRYPGMVAFQTCIPPYGGPIVIKVGRFI